MINFQQGDQYNIPIMIKNGDDYVSQTSPYTGVRIQIGGLLKYWENNSGTTSGTLTYNSTTHNWNFPVSESESRALAPNTPIQIAVRQTDSNNVETYYYSSVQTINFFNSLITQNWGGSSD